MMTANFIFNLFLPPKKCARRRPPAPAGGVRRDACHGGATVSAGPLQRVPPPRARGRRRTSMYGYVSELNVRGRRRLFAGAITGRGFEGAGGGQDGDSQQEPEEPPGPEQRRVRPPASAEEEGRLKREL